MTQTQPAATAPAFLGNILRRELPSQELPSRELLRRTVNSVPTIWGAWVIARLIIAYLMIFNNHTDTNPLGDVAYYFSGIYGNDPKALTEYPHAGTWPSSLLAMFTGNFRTAFLIGFPMMILCCDGLFLSLILRRHTTTTAAFEAAWFWIAFGTAVGHVFVLRFDLFPALAVGAAGYFLFRHPAIAGIFLSWATAMKLWPAVLAAGLVGKFTQARTWTAIVAFIASLAGFILITVTTVGWDRVTSPLNYQKVRGLQVESIFATPFMWQKFFTPGVWKVGYAPSKSFEITGPGVANAVTASTIVMALVVGIALIFALYRFFAGQWSPESALAFLVFMVLALLMANKVFSPQYTTWIGPILAVALSRGGYPRLQHRLVWIIAILAVVCGGLGEIVYPFHYNAVWKDSTTDFLPILCLVIRNISIIIMTALAGYWLYLTCQKPTESTEGTDSTECPDFTECVTPETNS